MPHLLHQLHWSELHWPTLSLPFCREPSTPLCTGQPGVASPNSSHRVGSWCEQEPEQPGPVVGLCWALGHHIANKGSFVPLKLLVCSLPALPSAASRKDDTRPSLGCHTLSLISQWALGLELSRVFKSNIAISYKLRPMSYFQPKVKIYISMISKFECI